MCNDLWFFPFVLILQENRNKIHQAVKINSDALSCVIEKLQKFIKLNSKIHKGVQVTSEGGTQPAASVSQSNPTLQS